MANQILSINDIIADPSIRSGRPILAGTSICVSDIVAWHLGADRLTLAEIATDFRLSLAQVYAARAYCYAHQAQIEAEMEQSAAEAEQSLHHIAREGRLLL